MITRELFIRYVTKAVPQDELAAIPEDEFRGLAFLESAALLIDQLRKFHFTSTAMRLSDHIISGDYNQVEATIMHCQAIFTNLDEALGSEDKPHDVALSYATAALSAYDYLMSFYGLTPVYV